MRMYNKLPHTLEINNKEIKINTDYRLFVKFELEMQGNDTKKAILNVLSAFYPAFLLKNITSEMVDKFIWFYKCGKEETQKGNKKGGKSQRAFDYKEDGWVYLICLYYDKNDNSQSIKNATFDGVNIKYLQLDELIYSAFMENYNIDLSKYMHWWKFKALFKGLNSECEFCKIKSYRMYDGKDKNLLELKEYYKLPPTQNEIEDRIRQNKLYEALK